MQLKFYNNKTFKFSVLYTLGPDWLRDELKQESNRHVLPL